MKTYDLDKLISANQQPEIDRETFRPFFNERFDFKEQSRVEEAISDICKNWTGHLWFELVSRSDDASYCLTTYRPSAPGARNWTVGEVCEELAYLQLTRIFDEVGSALATDDIAKGKIPYAFRLLEGQSLKEWVKSHSFKRFEDALAQAVSSAISQIASDEKLSIEKCQNAVKILKQRQAEVVLVENGIGQICFAWEKHSLVTRRRSR